MRSTGLGMLPIGSVGMIDAGAAMLSFQIGAEIVVSTWAHATRLPHGVVRSDFRVANVPLRSEPGKSHGIAPALNAPGSQVPVPTTVAGERAGKLVKRCRKNDFRPLEERSSRVSILYGVVRLRVSRRRSRPTGRTPACE